jgi:hypothetical protein
MYFAKNKLSQLKIQLVNCHAAYAALSMSNQSKAEKKEHIRTPASYRRYDGLCIGGEQIIAIFKRELRGALICRIRT